MPTNKGNDLSDIVSKSNELNSPVHASNASAFDWAAKHVTVGVAGGIACYKACHVVSQLAQAGAAVRVLMTPAATKFVTPLTFQTLSANRVITSIWESAGNLDSQHVASARETDIVIICPATANTIAKLASGICDDVLSLTVTALPRQTPVLLAPAMNAQMWQYPATQRNIQVLKNEMGFHFVGPETGWQACRTLGQGRMSEPKAIVDAAAHLLK